MNYNSVVHDYQSPSHRQLVSVDGCLSVFSREFRVGSSSKNKAYYLQHEIEVSLPFCLFCDYLVVRQLTLVVVYLNTVGLFSIGVELTSVQQRQIFSRSATLSSSIWACSEWTSAANALSFALAAHISFVGFSVEIKHSFAPQICESLCC